MQVTLPLPNGAKCMVIEIILILCLNTSLQAYACRHESTSMYFSSRSREWIKQRLNKQWLMLLLAVFYDTYIYGYVLSRVVITKSVIMKSQL